MLTATEAIPDKQTAKSCPKESTGNRFVVSGISWAQYEALQKVFEGRHVRMTYDEGTLEIMTTGPIHEGGKTLMARLLYVLSDERDIPVAGYGEMTWKRKAWQKGLESDECYFIRNEALARDPRTIDPNRSTPDLAIEMEVSNRLGTRREINAAMGVPELWCFDGRTLVFLHLNAAKAYEPRETSLSFPFLQSADLQRFLLMQPEKSQHEVVRAFREWVRTTREAK